MLTFPNIDPIAFQVGPVAVRWYGLSYLIGLVAGYPILQWRLKQANPEIDRKQMPWLLLWSMVGLVLGSRLGEIFFYHWAELGHYLRHPVEIIATWKGGMSFHGGLIGVIAAFIIFLRVRRIPILPVFDAACLAGPVGLFLAKLGNFINGELYGRISQVPWAMVFPGAGPEPRHPSQLYEALLEGPALFAFLWLFKDRVGPGRLGALFAIGYSVARFLVEFWRQPAPHLGFVFAWLTMGQILSLVQVAAVALAWVIVRKWEKSRGIVAQPWILRGLKSSRSR